MRCYHTICERASTTGSKHCIPCKEWNDTVVPKLKEKGKAGECDKCKRWYNIRIT